jgi:hypothetical protein
MFPTSSELFRSLKNIYKDYIQNNNIMWITLQVLLPPSHLISTLELL